jgi:hypothetical protein
MKKPAAKKINEPVTATPLVAARDFFAVELRKVLEKRKVEAQQSFDYLVELLTRSIESESFFGKTADGKPADHFLVGLYGEYMQGSPEVKRQTLQRLGDVCLMITGFFPDSLNRKLVDVDYYAGMGGAAYWQLSLWQSNSPLFQELSVKFRSFSDVLSELSEKSGMQTNTDLLRVYERWLYSGSDRLKEMLAEKGIETPVRIETKTRH